MALYGEHEVNLSDCRRWTEK